MDVIKFLLNTAMYLTLALMRFAVAGVRWLLDKLTNRIRTKAQPQPVPQEPQRVAAYVPSAPPPSPTATAAAPDVHVHVHIAPEAQRSSAPTRETAGGATILSRPDDRLYITTGSHLMMEHPDSERLLESLDHMLYVAAHRSGKPFHLTPLDDSNASAGGLPLPPLHNETEDEFFSSERRDLPAADGAVWVRKAGQAAYLAAGMA